MNGGSYLKSQNYRLKRSKFPYPREVNEVTYQNKEVSKDPLSQFPYPREVNEGSYMMIKILELFGGIGFRTLARRMGVLQFDWIDENKERGAFPYPCKLAGVSCIGKRSVYV